MKQPTLRTPYFLSSDLSLAAAISLSFPIEEIDQSNPRKAVFVFKRTSELEEFVESYYRNEVQVSPQAYFNQLREIKTRLYAGKHVW